MARRRFEFDDSADKLTRAKTGKGDREAATAGREPRRAPKAAPGSATRGTACLDAAIYREAAGKGAKIDQRRALPKSVKRCPDFIAEFHERIVWPKGRVFDATIGEEELYQISFDGPVQAVPPEYLRGVAGCKAKDLFGFGSQQGGNKILLLDGNDRNRSDPTVYEIDHHPEPGDSLLRYCRLSRFLRCLESRA